MEQNVREVLNHLHRVIGHVDGQCKNPEIGEVAKVSLYQQYFDEKANVINKIYHNLDWFFKNGSAWERNHLTTLEKDMEQRLNQLREHTNPAGGDLALEAHRLIEELGSNINKSISDAKEQAASMSFTDEEAQQLDELRNGRPEGEAFGSVAMEELNRLAAWEGGVRQRMQSLQTQVYQLRDTIARTYYYQINQLSHSLGKPPAASAKKKNMERYIGLNILNALGVLLLIVGTIAAGRLGHIWVAFVLGVGFLVAGEIMNRRRPNVFSMGLTAGGLGISYVTLAIGHFFQESIPMYPALGICVVITALAFYLSTRYKSQTLLAITLVGGYLPILTTLMDTRPDQALIFGMMGYFVMFNLLALVVALRNKWTVATFVGLTLNIAGVRLLTHHIGDDGRIFGIIYTGFAMLVYTIIPIISTRLTKIKFTPWDVALVGVNTFFGSIVLFNILHMWG
ncbi:MAG: DUF2339 domain-containing protein, partial [Defluviitaleaceae bacterium]|nr:DUF2339 domain-containing protein [Defluviitaleaceae bacterium]